MILRNTSPYHTATLRKIFVTTMRAVRSQSREVDRQWNPRVIFSEGRKRLRWNWVEGAKVPTMLVQTPKLTGDEFISLMRQLHGNPNNPEAHGALTSLEVAKVAQHVTAVAFSINIGIDLDSGVIRALAKAKIPKYVPFRVRKPVKEEAPRNIVQERYERALELEAKWTTKYKLAQTKLKKLRLKRRHYEKKYPHLVKEKE